MDAPKMAWWNLALRFLLELAAVFAIGAWGWSVSEGWPRYVLMIGLPLVAIALWGTFNVRGDPSRSGNAPVPVPGLVRLLVELIVLGSGGAAMFMVWSYPPALIYTGAVIIHYTAGWKRLVWLVGR